MEARERRGDFRHEKSISIHYTGIGGLNGYGYAETQDVSSRGLSFYCDSFLRKELRLDLELDVGSTKIVVRDARVAWAVKVAHSENYSIGLEFDDMAPAEYRQLVECGTQTRAVDSGDPTPIVEIQTD